MKLLVVAVSLLANLLVVLGNEGDDIDPSCPYIYDDYKIEMKIAGIDVNFDLDLSKYGLSHGYYCSLGTELDGASYNFRFDNCSCGSIRHCTYDYDSFVVKLIFGKLTYNVGKCEFDQWVITVPSILGALFFSLCCCAFIRRRRSRIVVVQEAQYVRLPDGTNARIVNQTV